jgi:hypothetical protein
LPSTYEALNSIPNTTKKKKKRKKEKEKELWYVLNLGLPKQESK